MPRTGSSIAVHHSFQNLSHVNTTLLYPVPILLIVDRKRNPHIFNRVTEMPIRAAVMSVMLLDLVQQLPFLHLEVFLSYDALDLELI